PKPKILECWMVCTATCPRNGFFAAGRDPSDPSHRETRDHASPYEFRARRSRSAGDPQPGRLEFESRARLEHLFVGQLQFTAVSPAACCGSRSFPPTGIERTCLSVNHLAHRFYARKRALGASSSELLHSRSDLPPVKARPAHRVRSLRPAKASLA